MSEASRQISDFEQTIARPGQAISRLDQALARQLGFCDVADAAIDTPISAAIIDPREYAGMNLAFHDLSGRCLAANPFMSPAVLTALAAQIGFDRIHVVVAHAGKRPQDGLLGVWAFRRMRDVWSGGIEVLQTPMTPLYDTSSAPVLDRAQASDARKALISTLRSAPGLPRIIRAASLPVTERDAMAAYCVTSSAERWTRAVLVPDGEAGGDVEAALSSLMGTAYKRRAKAEQAMARKGELRHETWRGARAVAGLEAFMALEARGWKGTAGSALAKLPADAAYVRSVVSRLADDDAMAVDLLMLDGTPIAVGLLLDGPAGTVFWKTAFDEAYGKFSPGVLLDMAVTRRVLRERRPLLDSGMMEFTDPSTQIWSGRQDFTRCMIDFSGGLPGMLVRLGKHVRHRLRLLRRGQG